MNRVNPEDLGAPPDEGEETDERVPWQQPPSRPSPPDVLCVLYRSSTHELPMIIAGALQAVGWGDRWSAHPSTVEVGKAILKSALISFDAKPHEMQSDGSMGQVVAKVMDAYLRHQDRQQSTVGKLPGLKFGPDPRSTAPKERSVVLDKAPPNHETGDDRNQIVYDPENWIRTFFAVKGRSFPHWQISIATALGSIVLGLFKYSYSDGDALLKDLGTTQHSMAGVAIFFLLGFRANASNDRYYEGRKQWGMVINRTRDLARLFVGLIPDDTIEVGGGVHRRAVGYIVAFCVTMKRHLRDERDLGELSDVLDPDDIAAIKTAQHMPLFTIEVLTEYVEIARRKGAIDSIQSTLFHENLTGFEDFLGACERIKKTPMPFAMVVHLRTGLMLWLISLPLVLYKYFGLSAIAVTFVVAYLLLGVEAVGTEIEMPFGHDANDLPLGNINDTIKANLKEIVLRSQKIKNGSAECGALVPGNRPAWCQPK